MSNRINGSFFFKRTATGNLIGEFTNTESSEITPEVAVPQGQNTSFSGIYTSTWFDTEHHLSTLLITQNGVKFKLEWREPTKKGYKGEGMLVDGILVGHYEQL